MEQRAFMPIKDACEYTGLSQYYLRRGCISGSIPHILSGNKYFINIPRLMEQLNALPARGQSNGR